MRLTNDSASLLLSRLPAALARRSALAGACALMLGAGLLTGCGGGGGDGGDNSIVPIPAPVVGDTYVLTSTGRLLSFNRLAPAASGSYTYVTTGMATATNVVGGDVRPSTGKLYVLSKATGTNVGTLSTIDPATGAVGTPITLKPDTVNGTADAYSSLSGTRFAVDFNPVTDRLRIVSDTGQNLRVNPDTGAVTTDANINSASATTPVMVVEEAYTNNLTDACGTQLLAINGTDGNLYTQDPPNGGTVGNPKTTGLTLTPTDVVRFDVRTAPTSARPDEGVLLQGNATGTTLYSLDTATGKTTKRGTLTLNTGESVAALFVTAAPAGTVETGPAGAQQGALVGVLSGFAVTFNPASPQKLCTAVALGGLASGESVLDIDYRPSNGSVYAVTSAAKLYTLNPYTGALAGATPLIANPTAATSGAVFTDTTGLPTTEDYGIDFEPTTDVLRLVSSTGRNYRINPANGQVTVDTKLPTANVITDVAYTNSAPLANGTTPYAAPSTTALYDLDSAANHLVQQTSPNTGTVTDVGALGFTATRQNGFDIVSAHSSATDVTATSAQTNTAYAALTVTNAAGTAAAGLYTVNTGTGAATLVNTIGTGAGTISGLTRAK